MIFVDTSAIFALADRADLRHEEAKAILASILEEGTPLLTHSYVLVESMALVQSRLGARAARELARSRRHFEVEWVGEAIHAEAEARLAASGSKRVSLVDQVSFAVMRRRRLSEAFAFDSDFAAEGFRLRSR